MRILTYVKRCILFSLFLFLHSLCSSQAYKYRFRTINLPEEFKNQYISLVDEDAAGMLWFVTTSGLHRYDGNQVLTFDMQSTPALPDADIQLLVADKQNHIWVVVRNKLVCFNLQQWSTQVIPFQRRQAVLQNDGITSITEGKDGTLYVGCSNKLYRVINDSLEFITHISNQVDDSTNNFINDIHEPVSGQLLLSISNGKIVSIQHQQTVFASPVYVDLKQLPNASAPSSFTPLAPKYLMNSSRGPCVVDMKQMAATPLVDPAKNSLLQNSNYNDIHLAELGGNQVVFFYKNREASETGLLVYNREQNIMEDLSMIYPAALKTNKLRGVSHKNGHVLIPIKGGIATISYTGSAFDVFAASLDNANSIRSIYKVPGVNLFIGSYLYDFIQFDEVSNTLYRRPGSIVSCALHWQRDTLLIGTEGGGFGWYLFSDNRFVSLTNHVSTASMNPFTNCLTRESDTSVWVGTYAGFYLINPYTRRILQSSIPNGNQPSKQLTVYDILKVGSARFFATIEGLFKYDVLQKSWTKLLTSAMGNYANSNFTCLRLVNNQVWAGTIGNGLLVLDTAGNLVRKITTADGLAGNVIFSNPLCNNYLFVGTRTGLSIINLLSGKISNYSSEYYLPADEFNRSAWCVNGDTVYMGTINGFIRIDTKRLEQQQTEAAPDIRFSSFTYSNGRTSLSDYTLPYRKNVSLTISPEASNFSIAFGALTEMAAGLKLYYRLSADAPWQDIGQRREVTFVNVAPDKYTMQIAARMPDGRWMENILTLPITVQPRFYQTWWWKGLLLATALGLIWLGIKYRERNLLKEQRLRSRIAGDLHDEVGSALTRIYVQAGMLTTADGKATAPPTIALQQIASTSQEAISSMSDMVWSIEAQHDNAPDMVDRMQDYIARLQDELDCHITVGISGSYENLKLSQVVRQNIMLIFKEAMNNAIKYGSNKTAAVQLLLNDHILQLEVINKLPATGIAESLVQGGHGMKSMRLRADKIKAKLSVTHTANEFRVQLLGKPF